jgi:asparagine synthase (glutamine-hydrolysing)
MAQLMSRPVSTCTVGFNEERYSEISHARSVARHFDADHHQTMVSPNAADVVERLAWHYDEPFADSSSVPTYYVSKAARERVTVALSGDGGDESFAGYRRYVRENADNRRRSMFPLTFRNNVLRPLGRWYPELEGAAPVFRAKNWFQRMGRDPLEGYLARITVPGSIRESLLSDDLKEQLRDYDPLDQFREHYQDLSDRRHLRKSGQSKHGCFPGGPRPVPGSQIHGSGGPYTV